MISDYQELISRKAIYLHGESVLLQFAVETFSPYEIGVVFNLDGKPYSIADVSYHLTQPTPGAYLEAQLIKLIEAIPTPDLTQALAQSSVVASRTPRVSALTLPMLTR